MTFKTNRLLKSMLPFLALPAVFIGIYTMKYFNIPKQFWIINLASVSAFTILSLFFYKNIFHLINTNSTLILSFASILLLVTFWHTGVDGVHRWINLGSIKLNIGLIITPLILFQISKEKKIFWCCSLYLFAITVFLLQPDASLLLAFSISALILLISKLKNKLIIIGLIFLTLISIIFSWYNLDKLQPVNYVEGILDMTSKISIFLFICSLFSLLLLILPFFLVPLGNDRLFISLGVYYLLLIVSSFIGNFPVMICGYGISPIIGYFIGLLLLIEKTKNKNIIVK